VLFKFLEERKLLYEIILLGFFIQWLPWARISYFNFFYYFSPAMAFATMAIALLMSRIWQIGRLGRGIVIGYVVIVAVLFIYWYPLYTGFPVSEWYFRNHLWFKAWL
jgi:dolichyl-phosphate-mannose--protein O-mannosyl transferase